MEGNQYMQKNIPIDMLPYLTEQQGAALQKWIKREWEYDGSR